MAPEGYVAVDGDCNDDDEWAYPGAAIHEPDDACVLDGDQDGYGSATAWEPYDLGQDCDDTDSSVNPDGQEMCDYIDNDCDGTIDENTSLDAETWYLDDDGDGFGNPVTEMIMCWPPNDAITNGDDCDDTSASVYPGAPEYCNSIDDNCDTLIDEPTAIDATLWYVDTDMDGFGTGPSMAACTQPSGYESNNSDCDDTDSTINPNAAEVCDGIDQDCDGIFDNGLPVTLWYADADADGYGSDINSVESCIQPSGFLASAGDCNDFDPVINPAGNETCNGVDDDCDGSIDETPIVNGPIWYQDADGDGFGSATAPTVSSCTQPAGYVSNQSDCNDNNDQIHPNATESCNGADDNCNGITDESSAIDANTWYTDADGDGIGVNPTQIACSQPAGYTISPGDCDDNNAAVSPVGQEVCNNIDDDCNGVTDDNYASNAATWYLDTDADGFGGTSTTLSCSQPSGYASASGDCNDGNNSINPNAAEICDGIDQNCDGAIDNGIPTSQWFFDLRWGRVWRKYLYLELRPAQWLCWKQQRLQRWQCQYQSTRVKFVMASIKLPNGAIDEGLPTATYYYDGDGDGFGGPSGISKL